MPRTGDRYWLKRVRSAAFKRRLAAVISSELGALGRSKVKDVVDAAAVHRSIREWDFAGIDRDLVADLLVTGSRRLEDWLGVQRRSLLELLGPQLAEDVEALLEAEVSLPRYAEELVGKLMDQELIHRLLTDLVFTAITDFYRRLNPLFGAMTTRMLEDQIKGFIGLFMPTLQRQAVGFVTSRANQRAVLDFGRAIIRQLLDEPLSAYGDVLSAGDRRQAEVLLRKVLHNGKLDAAVRQAAAEAWDDLYGRIRNKPIADLVDVERHADWLTDRILDGFTAMLSRPDVARFIGDEIAVATGLSAGKRGVPGNEPSP